MEKYYSFSDSFFVKQGKAYKRTEEQIDQKSKQSQNGAKMDGKMPERIFELCNQC